ncbi:Flagellar hook-basal body complex protein FliE [bacterium HR40]|nr:Flagellar hook-basal body complex protein FliE [bacterium HR40]
MTETLRAIGTAAGTPATNPTALQERTHATRFEEFLARELAHSLDTLYRGEEVAKRGVAGLASVQEVVEAVTAAELALDRIVAVRDRVIQAYQEIMRMPI